MAFLSLVCYRSVASWRRQCATLGTSSPRSAASRLAAPKTGKLGPWQASTKPSQPYRTRTLLLATQLTGPR